MLDMLPLVCMGDARQPLAHRLRLPYVLGFKVAVLGEKGIAASIGPRCQAVTVLGAELGDGRNGGSVIPSAGMFLVAVKLWIVWDRDGLKSERRIVFDADDGGAQADQSFQEPIII